MYKFQKLYVHVLTLLLLHLNTIKLRIFVISKQLFDIIGPTDYSFVINYSYHSQFLNVLFLSPETINNNNDDDEKKKRTIYDRKYSYNILL